MLPYQINAEHKLAAEGNFPNGSNKIPGWVLDVLAERRLSGGYSYKRNPPCPVCFVRKSNNGTCNC